MDTQSQRIEQTKQQPKLPDGVSQAAQSLDEVLADLPKTREEHNALASALRFLVSKIAEQAEELRVLKPEAPATTVPDKAKKQ